MNDDDWDIVLLLIAGLFVCLVLVGCSPAVPPRTTIPPPSTAAPHPYTP